MPYTFFGGGPSDVTTDAQGNVVGGVQFEVYTQLTGGVRITDLRDVAGAALPGKVISNTTTGPDLGRVLFQAPDTHHVLYLDRGYGDRWQIETLNLGALIDTAIDKSDTAFTVSQDADAKADQALAHVRGEDHGIFRVLDYGATGAGVVDDAPAIQAAIDAAASIGGGEVVFSPNAQGQATFLTYTPIVLRDNITLRGEGHPIIKRNNPTGPYAVFISGSTTGKLGYGAGASNITMTGLTFRGNFSTGVNACALALHHSRNVLIQDCRFVEFDSEGHTLDLAGCENVTVRDCTWEGSNRGTGAHEAIQIDISAYSAVSAHLDGDAYDALPTRRVLVTGCRFVPLQVGATLYPGPQPIGSHAEYEDAWFEDIRFIDNIVVDPPVEGTWLPGVVHFSCARDVEIRGNTFRTTGRLPVPVSPVVGFHHAPRAFPKTADPNLPLSGYIDLTNPMKPTRIVVEGNHIVGFGNTSRTSFAAIWMHAGASTRIEGNLVDGFATGTCDGAIVTRDSESVVVDNIVKGTGTRGIYTWGASTGRIAGNQVAGFTTPIAAASTASAVDFDETQAGWVTVPIPSAGTASVTVTFPTRFSRPPMVVATRSATVAVADVFVSVSDVTETSVKVNVRGPASSTQYVNWIATTT